MSDDNKFWGMYRGTVINNIDPEQRGRLLLQVPDVLSLIPSSWAERTFQFEEGNSARRA